MNKLTLLLVAVVAAYVSAQCTKTTFVTTEGGTCGGTSGASCISELSCMGATATTSGTCKFQLQVGDACTTDADCANSYYNQFCSTNKCAIRYKNAGASCAVNGECAGNSCVSGSCAALQVGSACTTNALCGSPTNALFCATANGTCAATAASGAACGAINGVFVQCVPGFYCVGSGTAGTCQAGVTTEGSTCASGATPITNIWANPGCSQANNALSCISSKCVAPTATIAIGQPCGTTDILVAGKSCNPRESFCTGGVCTAYSSVTCNTISNCGGGVCNCQSDLTKNGTCAVNPYLTTSCATNRYNDCTATVNTQNSLNTCGDKLKGYRCCLRNLNLVPNKDLTLAYCSSATFAQVSIVVMAVVAMIALLF